MRTNIGLTAICTLTLLASCAKEAVPNKGQTVPRPGICRVTVQNVARTGTPPALGTPMPRQRVQESVRCRVVRRTGRAQQ